MPEITEQGSTPPDLEAISEKWLQVCPSCDAGLPASCTHPDEDYRPVMLELVREIERLRTEIKRTDQIIYGPLLKREYRA